MNREDSNAVTRAWDGPRAAVQFNARRIGIQGGTACLVWAVFASVTSVAGVGLLLGKVLMVVAPLVAGVGLRMGVLSIAAQQSQHRGRRLLLRWVPRLLWTATLPGWAMAAVPFVSVVAVPLTLLVLTTLVTAYAIWTVDREVAGLAPHRVEWVLLVAVAMTALGVLALALAAAAGAGLLWQWWSASV